MFFSQTGWLKSPICAFLDFLKTEKSYGKFKSLYL